MKEETGTHSLNPKLDGLREVRKEKKDSEKYWDQKIVYVLEEQCYLLPSPYKEVYDQLVSIEAKIEELDEVKAKNYGLVVSVYAEIKIKEYQSELQQLKDKYKI